MPNEFPRNVARYLIPPEGEPREPVRCILGTSRTPVSHALTEMREPVRHTMVRGDFLEGDFSGDDFAT